MRGTRLEIHKAENGFSIQDLNRHYVFNDLEVLLNFLRDYLPNEETYPGEMYKVKNAVEREARV